MGAAKIDTKMPTPHVRIRKIFSRISLFCPSYTPSISYVYILLTDSYSLKKLINLVNNIKFIHDLYYSFKITFNFLKLIISLFT